MRNPQDHSATGLYCGDIEFLLERGVGQVEAEVHIRLASQDTAVVDVVVVANPVRRIDCVELGKSAAGVLGTALDVESGAVRYAEEAFEIVAVKSTN